MPQFGGTVVRAAGVTWSPEIAEPGRPLKPGSAVRMSRGVGRGSGICGSSSGIALIADARLDDLPIYVTEEFDGGTGPSDRPMTTPGLPMIPSLTDRATAVRLFDSRHGESERVLWFLSQHARGELLAGEGGPIVETLVWTLKSWWGVQGVSLGLQEANRSGHLAP